jgi:hypothetical protein
MTTSSLLSMSNYNSIFLVPANLNNVAKFTGGMSFSSFYTWVAVFLSEKSVRLLNKDKSNNYPTAINFSS